MTVAWQSIPGQGLYTPEKQIKKHRQVVLKRLNKALGEGLTQELLDKELVVLLPSFDGYAALNAASGKGLIPMERSCVYIQAHNTVYVNLEHFEDPALISHVVSALAFDTIASEDKRLAFYKNACTQLLHSFGDNPFDFGTLRNVYRKRARIAIRAKLDQLPKLKAFFEDYWLNNHENRKEIPAFEKCAEKKYGKKLPAAPITEQDIVAYLFGNIYRFAQSESKRSSSLFDITQAPRAHIRLACLAKKTTDKLPGIDKLFGKKLNKHGVHVSATFAYPAELGMIRENANPRYAWNLDTEMSDMNWRLFFSNRTVSDNKPARERSIFANGIVMAARPRIDASINIAVTHEVDMVSMENRTLSVLPFVSQEAQPFVAQIEACSVPKSLDWALLKLKSKKYDLNFSALNTSWLAQAAKLNAYTDYSVNLTFWAMAADLAQEGDNKDLCQDTELSDKGYIPHYKLVVKIVKVLGESYFEDLDYKIFNVKPSFNKKSFPEITAALPTRVFKALKLGNRKTVVLHGIFLATGFNGLKFYDVDVPEVMLESPNTSPLAMRRHLNLAVINDEIAPEAATIHLGRLVTDIGQHNRFSQGYYDALKAAAAYGHFDSLKSLADIYEKALVKRQQHKPYNLGFVSDCEGKVLNRFLRLCQMGCAPNLEFLAFEHNEWLPTPQDIRARLSRYLALTHNSGAAWDNLARNYRKNRALDKMRFADLVEYRGYLAHAVFECNYWPAAKPLAELYLSGKLPHTSLEETIGLILNVEKMHLSARAWFTGIMLLQDRFFTASDREIFEAFKKEAQFGSPLYVKDFAWFLITTAVNKRNTPKAWALTGVALLKWLVDRFDCPAYFDQHEAAVSILLKLGVAHRLPDFDPWKYLDLEAPTEEVPLVKSVRPVGFPGFMHQTFLESLANITEGDGAHQVQARLASIFEFLAENASELDNVTGKSVGADEKTRGNAKILSFGQKDKNECIVTQTPNADGSWSGESICPVFNEGLTLDMKIMGGVTDLGLCTGVVTATSDGLDTLQSFDPYWMLHAQELCVGDICRISYYGLGEIKPSRVLLSGRINVHPEKKHIECMNERTAQYVVVSVVKSVKTNVVEIAGVSFAKVVILLNDFVPHLADAQLPVYVPMNQFDARVIKPKAEVVAVFELHGKISTDSEISETLFGVRTIN